MHGELCIFQLLLSLSRLALSKLFMIMTKKENNINIDGGADGDDELDTAIRKTLFAAQTQWTNEIIE